MVKQNKKRATRGGLRRRKGKKGNKTRGKKQQKQYFKKPVVFGHVYSDQCIHCQNMQKEWDTMCKSVKVPLHDIGENHQHEVQKFNQQYSTNLEANGFPTIFKLQRHKTPVSYYQGERTAPAMKKWIYG